MVAQCGRDVVFRIDANNDDTYAIVGGIKNAGVAVNNEPVNITNSDSGGWREFLSGCGMRAVTFTGSGVFVDDPAAADALSLSMSGLAAPADFMFPDFVTFKGGFVCTTCEFNGGEDNGEVSYSMTFESSGPITVETV